MKTTARLPFEKVRFDLPFRTHLAVTLEAPPVEWQRTRPPVCVIPVIDVSGSMAGDKLEKVKRSVEKLVDQLAPGDFCGVVTFTTDVTTVSAPVQMVPDRKAALRAAVGKLEASASTNLSGGMLEGLRLANSSPLPDGMLVRVILFTDGCANAGIATTSEALLPLLGEHLGRATLSAFGYGRDADQELLRDLSTRGKGNYAFVAGPDDALTAFARELGGLLSTYAQDIVLRVRPLGGSRITAVLSDVDADPVGHGVEIRIPDILAEETRNVVVSVELPAAPFLGAAPERAFEVEVAWKALAGGKRVVEEKRVFAAMVERVAPGLEQVRPDRDVDVIVAQAELVRAQIEAEELARHGRHQEAHERVLVLYQSVLQRGHAAEARAAQQVSETLKDEAAFRESTAFRSSMRKGMARSSSVMMDAEAEATLSTMGFSRKNKAQNEMDEIFKEPKGPAKARAPGAAPGGPKRTRARRW
ncbi:MAG: VWA domain-containing protein [Anaeromyxobacteraceae bacterium]